MASPPQNEEEMRAKSKFDEHLKGEFWHCVPVKRKPTPQITMVHSFFFYRKFNINLLWENLISVSGQHLALVHNSSLYEHSQLFQKFTKGIFTKCRKSPTAIHLEEDEYNVAMGFPFGIILVRSSSGRDLREWKCHENSNCHISCITKSRQGYYYWACYHGFSMIDDGHEPTNRLYLPGIDACIGMKISPSGYHLAASEMYNGVRIMNASSLELIHHIENNIQVAMGFDWHPWENGLLVTGQFQPMSCLYVWNVLEESPLVPKHAFCFDHFIYALLFHPITGELVASMYTPARHYPYSNCSGKSSLVILDGNAACKNFVNITECGVSGKLFWDQHYANIMVLTARLKIMKYQYSNPKKDPLKQWNMVHPNDTN